MIVLYNINYNMIIISVLKKFFILNLIYTHKYELGRSSNLQIAMEAMYGT